MTSARELIINESLRGGGVQALNDAMTWWAAFGAIAQAAGAVATFGAIVVALVLARAERGLLGRGRATIMLAVSGDGTPGEYELHFELENTGMRPLVWETTSWRVGWLRWGPNALRYRWALQSDHLGSPFTTQTIEPAMTGRVAIPVQVMKGGLQAAEDRDDFFRGPVPLLGYPPIVAFANVAGRSPIPLKVSAAVTKFMRTGDHPDQYVPEA